MNEKIKKEFERKNLDQLRELARKVNLAGYSGCTKEALKEKLLLEKSKELETLLCPTFWQKYQNTIFGMASILSLFIGISQYSIFQPNEKLATSTKGNGTLSGRVINKSLPIKINLGSNLVEYPYSTLQKGINFGETLPFKIGTMKLPVKIYSENERLMVDASIYGPDQKVLCQVIRNDWEINPNTSFDRNYSVNSFEIVDNNLDPIFQILVQEGNKIFIGGYFFSKSGQKIYYSPDGVSDVKPVPQRLFLYPSKTNFGAHDNLAAFSKSFADERK